MTRLGKTIDKQMYADIEDILISSSDSSCTPMDTDTVNSLIADEMFRDGLQDIGNTFVQEAKLTSYPIEGRFVGINRVLETLRSKQTQPCLDWITEQCDGHNHSDNMDLDNVHELRFSLHKLHFLQLLQQQQQQQQQKGTMSAITYAKQHFSSFSESHKNEIHRLCGCLLFASSTQCLSDSPYADLLDTISSQWQHAELRFVRVACTSLGLSHQSPLFVSLLASNIAIPKLLKFMAILRRSNHQSLQLIDSSDSVSVSLPHTQSVRPSTMITMSLSEHMPEIDLAKEYVYHSIFVCPVTKQVCDDSNPPTLLTCGHVISRNAMQSIASVSHTTHFKCPYCPKQMIVSQTKPIHF
jgi:E3 ubiquitin-protein transferase RMND5